MVISRCYCYCYLLLLLLFVCSWPGPDGTQQPGGSHEDGGTGRTWAAVDAMAAPTGILALRQDCPYVAFPMEDGGASEIRGC